MPRHAAPGRGGAQAIRGPKRLGNAGKLPQRGRMRYSAANCPTSSVGGSSERRRRAASPPGTRQSNPSALRSTVRSSGADATSRTSASAGSTVSAGRFRSRRLKATMRTLAGLAGSLTSGSTGAELTTTGRGRDEASRGGGGSKVRLPLAVGAGPASGARPCVDPESREGSAGPGPTAEPSPPRSTSTSCRSIAPKGTTRSRVTPVASASGRSELRRVAMPESPIDRRTRQATRATARPPHGALEHEATGTKDSPSGNDGGRSMAPASVVLLRREPKSSASARSCRRPTC